MKQRHKPRRHVRTATLASVTAIAIASVVSAQQPGTPGSGVLHVQGGIHMLVVNGINASVQIGDDGVLLVDTGDSAIAPQIIAAVRSLSSKPIHTIVNTHVHPDHVGGNESIVKQRGTGAAQPVRVIAHQSVLNRMLATAPAGGAGGFRINAAITLPINNTYDTPSKDFYLNGESIVMHHMSAAHTDGDSLVHFRRSDVLAVGDVFTPEGYPFIDRSTGGSVQGLIAALNRILEITVPARFQEGGTYVIPGHGRLSDEADVVEYRDMVTIIRDRIQDLITKGLTGDQVKAARPSRDYDTEYDGGRPPDEFVEAVYRSLTDK
jgi:cyclase